MFNILKSLNTAIMKTKYGNDENVNSQLCKNTARILLWKHCNFVDYAFEEIRLTARCL